MRLRSQLRFLIVYSASITLAFATTVYFGIFRPIHDAPKVVKFDRISVHRIDVVEPDGTPRLFISDRSDFPGEFFHKQEVKRKARSDAAGMLFLNDEGTEDGGLIYGGGIAGNNPYSFSHLSFDQYEQDQTVVIGASLENGSRQEGIQLNDAPEKSITPDLIAEGERIKAMQHGAQRAAAWADYQKRYPALTERAAFGRNGDGSVGLVLRDLKGRSRLELAVTADGAPVIKLLNEWGKVQKKLSLDK